LLRCGVAPRKPISNVFRSPPEAWIS
jgi:hypothetical protein